MIDPLDIDIGRNARYLETVDLGEFASLGHRRSGHAGQLFIEAEIVLECHRGHSLVFGLDFQPLARLNGLVEPFREAAPLHRASGEFIDNHDLAVLDHVVAVTLEQLVCPQGLVHMVQQPDILNVIKRAIAHRLRRAQKILGMFNAGLGERDRPPLLVEIVILRHEMWNNLIGNQILIGRRFGRAGDDQRRARLIDQDRVNLVDDGEMMLALHHVLNAEFQIVTKIVEAKLIVGTVGDVALIGRAAFFVAHIAGNAADRHAKAFINTTHPRSVA